MKTLVVLCTIVGVALVLGGCADQGSNGTASNTHAAKGLVDPGSVSSVQTGPDRPGHVPQRYTP